MSAEAPIRITPSCVAANLSTAATLLDMAARETGKGSITGLREALSYVDHVRQQLDRIVTELAGLGMESRRASANTQEHISVARHLIEQGNEAEGSEDRGDEV